MSKGFTLTTFRSFIEIAVGGTAVVFKATQKTTNQTVAIKLIEIDSVVNSMENIMSEVAICKTMHYPYIVEYFGCIKDQNYIYQVMEYVPGGSLLSWINDHHRLEDDEARRFFCQIISSLKYLHFARGIAHRDIKLENILLDEDNNIKLIDFGFIRERCPLMKTQCGTLPYSAPEIIKHSLYTLSVDIWSSGVVLYAMLTGAMPFSGINAEALIKEILNKDPVLPSSVNKNAADLIRRLLEKDPKKRISLREIECHPWISHCQYKEIVSDKFVAQHSTNTDNISSCSIPSLASIGLNDVSIRGSSTFSSVSNGNDTSNNSIMNNSVNMNSNNTLNNLNSNIYINNNNNNNNLNNLNDNNNLNNNINNINLNNMSNINNTNKTNNMNNMIRQATSQSFSGQISNIVSPFDKDESEIAMRIAKHFDLSILPPLQPDRSQCLNLIDIKSSLSESVRFNTNVLQASRAPQSVNFAVFRNMTQPKFVAPSNTQTVFGVKFRSNQRRSSVLAQTPLMDLTAPKQ